MSSDSTQNDQTQSELAQDWGNYWQGRNANEALAGVGVEKDAKLAAFWTDCFAKLPANARLLDMACGAGSVLRRAHAAGLTHLTGVDISADAIATMNKDFPDVHGVVSAVDNTPLETAGYDILVSQFGFEYAGQQDAVLATAREMARLIGNNGQFTALCHIQGGGIDEEVAGHLKRIAEIEQTEFIAAAKAVFTAAFLAEQKPSPDTHQAYQGAVEMLLGPRDALVNWMTAHQGIGGKTGELALHLYNGTLQMFNRRANYALKDITGWLDGMNAEIQAYKGRMNSMKAAALSESEAGDILQVFAEVGFEIQALEKLHLVGDDKAVAWILRANRLS